MAGNTNPSYSFSPKKAYKYNDNPGPGSYRMPPGHKIKGALNLSGTRNTFAWGD